MFVTGHSNLDAIAKRLIPIADLCEQADGDRLGITDHVRCVVYRVVRMRRRSDLDLGREVDGLALDEHPRPFASSYAIGTRRYREFS